MLRREDRVRWDTLLASDLGGCSGETSQASCFRRARGRGEPATARVVEQEGDT